MANRVLSLPPDKYMEHTKKQFCVDVDSIYSLALNLSPQTQTL